LFFWDVVTDVSEKADSLIFTAKILVQSLKLLTFIYATNSVDI